MKSVLIIEDDQWWAQQLERVLAAEFAVRRVSDGHSAMDHIDDQLPDVIVADMLLSGGTAVTLLHELQSYQDTSNVPVVLITNLASTIKITDLAPYGVRRILDKSTMHPDDVVVAVRSALL